MLRLAFIILLGSSTPLFASDLPDGADTEASARNAMARGHSDDDPAPYTVFGCWSRPAYSSVASDLRQQIVNTGSPFWRIVWGGLRGLEDLYRFGACSQVFHATGNPNALPGMMMAPFHTALDIRGCDLSEAALLFAGELLTAGSLWSSADPCLQMPALMSLLRAGDVIAGLAWRKSEEESDESDDDED